jgi:hypothetical protein
MSVECSECEWDARAGHDPECSRSPEAEIKRLQSLLEPIQAERDELRSEVTTLEWALSEATKAAERFQELHQRHCGCAADS